MSYVGLDFETYGAVSLPKHGLARYVGDKSFQPLIASVVAPASGLHSKGLFDRVSLFDNRKHAVAHLRDLIGPCKIVAHNATFEQAVLNSLGLDYAVDRFIDSAVVARAAGAAGHLEAAAPQLLAVDKMAAGRNLIKLFSVPGRYQEENGTPWFDARVIYDHPDEWEQFEDYCDLDAELGLSLVRQYESWLTPSELDFMSVTQSMNFTGWCVDIPMVEEMQRRYLENQEQAMYDFRVQCDAPDLNLNSLKQLREWCLARGVKAMSFDEKHVASLLVRVEKKLATMRNDDPKVVGYDQVLRLLQTKQVLGGSSLKKLQVILDTSVEDAWHPGRFRLKDQYLHCGAGQTLRTTGRSVQMQNLKRLHEVADMDELDDPGSEWDNTRLAENLRQAFTATDRNGRLIVGDFSSVESRGLAWLAGEQWKLSAYRRGQDLYKVLAASPEMFGVPYDTVTKEQRQSGKTGELSCGYGAGPGAVQAFAENMGISMSEVEAGRLVSGWRRACPRTTDLWENLDLMLHNIVEDRKIVEVLYLEDGFRLEISAGNTPRSLTDLHPAGQTVMMQVTHPQYHVYLKRFFHGCYVRGRNICYFKPSHRKTGDLWSNNYIDPKTKMLRFYELYGGKLAGILTQSFCRELFFAALRSVDRWCWTTGGQVQLVGQFHDEIVLDWKPGAVSLTDAKVMLERLMSDPGPVRSFPLTAEIKDDYRYTK